MGCSHSKLRSSRTSVVDIRGQRPQLQDSEACLPPKKMERPKTAHYKRRQSKVKFTKVKVLKKEGAPSKTNLKEVLKRWSATHHGKRERKKSGKNFSESGENSSEQQAEALHYESRPVPPEELKFTPYNLVEVDSELSLIELEPSHHQDEAKEVDISGIELEEEPGHHWEELPRVIKVENLKLPPTNDSKVKKTAASVVKKDKKPKMKKGVTFVLPAEPSDRVDTSEVSGPTTNSGACDGIITENSDSAAQQVAQLPDEAENLALCVEGVRMTPLPPSDSHEALPPTSSNTESLSSFGSRPPTRRGMAHPPPTQHVMVQPAVPSDIPPQLQAAEAPQKPKMERPKAAHYKRRLNSNSPIAKMWRQQHERMQARQEIRAGMDKFMVSQMRNEARQA